MSTGFNKVMIIGFLGHDPKIHHTKSGIAVTTLNIAVLDNQKKDNSWTRHTEWFNVVCLGKSAENTGKFLKKGRQVFVEGKLQNRLWEDKKGNNHVVTEIIAKHIIFLGKQISESQPSMEVTHDSGNNLNHPSVSKSNKKDGKSDIPF